MCGISGWFSLTSGYSNEHHHALENIKKIVANLHHRGPDNNSIWISKDKDCILGHNRLSIIDLSSTANQPMSSFDNSHTICFNGEIYNYTYIKKIINEKFSYNFKTNSDTEVALYALKYLGIDQFLEMADGMFAICIYEKSGEITLIRDRAGEKPIYYQQIANSIYFCSELRPLIKIQKSFKVDNLGLQLYLLLRYIPAPYSIIKGIRKIPAGHYLKIKKGEATKLVSYYSWQLTNKIIEDNSQNYQNSIKFTEKILTESIERAVISDVPLGFFLSSGVDSSLVTLLAKKILKKDVHTFSIGFENSKQSEHEQSKKIAQYIGTTHHEQIINQKDLSEISEKIGGVLDEPNGDRSCVPTYALCSYAKKYVKVAIGGDGGDELFGGYTRYIKTASDVYQTLSPKNKLITYLSRDLKVFGYQEIQSIFNTSFSSDEYLKILEPHLKYGDNYRDFRFLDFASYLPGSVLSKVDRIAMSKSLEVRTPFLSKDILNFAKLLPKNFLYKEGLQKPILRAILDKYGLGDISSLPKLGFGMPSDFLLADKESLHLRLKVSLEYLDNCSLLSLSQFGKLIGPFSKNNINSIWATILLADWLKSVESDLEKL